ncbi:HNH endonuclease, partial [Streptomyces katsurahamanus]|uniref:HNH endonuclease n=1 Tax=Streptomyces katsurahamanus TaxID=2577098 RepID=UPI002B20B838
MLSEGALCGHPGTDVDHIRPGNDHSMGNLQLLCGWCHKRKTQAESRAALAALPPMPKANIPLGVREPPP